ncbi:MAG: hypothetical protein HN855_12600 [Anaerolineae bacterium]|jgi:hemerythrin|nr:hypothetical protein [Anaerolineae bacterium]MBT7069291.1 hypothetical protein [Anaerolineae bacterium]MBT7325993.1 hypothetical protein [Anaerolineae bacterium]
MAIEWNEDMSTGIPEIDEEHKEWLRRYNEFDNAVSNQQGKELTKVALRFFEQYTEFHFPNEEWRASNHPSPVAEKNREEQDLLR